MSNAFIIRAGNITKNYVDTNLETKVDKITGKGLSTNAKYNIRYEYPPNFIYFLCAQIY